MVSVVVVVVFSVFSAGGVTMTVLFSITLSGPGEAVLTRASQALRRRGTMARMICGFMVVVVEVCGCGIDWLEMRLKRTGRSEVELPIGLVVVFVCI